MGFDRNTIIGFALLAVLFMGYFWYVSTNQKAAMELQKRQEDSLAALKPKVDSVQWRADSARLAATRDSISAGAFVAAANGKEELTTVENELMKLQFSNRGGWLHKVELKNYKGPDSAAVRMGGDSYEYFGYPINTQPGQSTESNKLFFAASAVKKNADGSQTLSYTLNADGGMGVVHTFTIKPDDYRVDANISLQGADKLVSNQTLNLSWQTKAHAQQTDAKYERTQTRLVYVTDGEYDFANAAAGASERLETPTNWVGIKQQFFNSTILAPTKFKLVDAAITTEADTINHEVATLKVNAQLPVPAGASASVPLTIYYGPNDYEVLKKYDNEMHNIVDLGSGMFAFVKWINRWIVLPVFDFLSRITGGVGGWTILLLTIIIRLLIAPLTYSSYLSGAKMKALRPEIDALKARLGNDQQAMSMEQMKLFREAGVNPLGGCIPALFQIPIFFALYSFFNANIDLRGIPFLWSHDLSSYDSIMNFSFNIPFLGSHISLFTILACVTSLLISVYTMSSTPDQGNPMLKYMPYIFPVMMLFIFNSLPSALTWYYTVSNVITLALQFVIQNYIINHDKILAEIQANKSKPKKKTKWQERLEAMQETQRKVEDMKKKNQGR